jgi:hypothetical protein
MVASRNGRSRYGPSRYGRSRSFEIQSVSLLNFCLISPTVPVYTSNICLLGNVLYCTVLYQQSVSLINTHCI